MGAATLRSAFSGSATPPTGFVAMTGHSNMVEGSGVAKPTSYAATCSIVFNTITSTADDRVIFTLGGSVLNDFAVPFRCDANTDHDEAGLVYFAIGAGASPAWNLPDTIELKKYTGGTPTSITPTNTANMVASKYPAIAGNTVSLRDTRLASGTKIEVQFIDDQLMVKINDQIRMHEDFTGRDATGYHGIISYAGSSTDQSYDTYKSGSMVGRYVATTGSDSNSGADPTTNAWRTIGKGYKSQAEGEVCFVLAGSYGENVQFTISSKPRTASSAEEPVCLMKKADEGLTETNYILTSNASGMNVLQHVYTYGLTLRNSGANCYGVQVDPGNGGSSHHYIQGCSLYDTSQNGCSLGNELDSTDGGWWFLDNMVQGVGRSSYFYHGIYIWGRDSQVKWNTFDGSAKNIGASKGYGVHMFNEANENANNNNIVAYNICKNYNQSGTGTTSVQAGLLVDDGDNMVVVGNVCYANKVGITIFSNTDGALVINNQLYDNTAYGIYVDGSADNTNNLLYNNTCYLNGTYGIRVQAGPTGTLITNNICYNNTTDDISDAGTGTVETNNWETTHGNPNFISTSGNSIGWDLGLQTGSGAATGGITLTPSIGAIDARGYPRPQGATWSRGALEIADPAGPPIVSLDFTASFVINTWNTLPVSGLGQNNDVVALGFDWTGSMVGEIETPGSATVRGPA